MKARRNQGVLAFEEAIGKNRLDPDDVVKIFEHAPSLGNLLCEGLTAVDRFGPVDVERLLDLATRGLIRTADIDEALSR
jgi:hypothetical protein